MFCNVGDKPTLYYRFASDSSDSKIGFDFAPIDITIGQDTGTTGNYNESGYQLSFYSPNNYFTETVIVLDYKIINSPGYVVLVPRTCGSIDFAPDSQGFEIDLSTLKIDTSIHCAGSNSNNQNCQISVSYEGNVVWSATGKCPVTYSVSCGDCPDGYGKIDCPHYPGYCCISCAEIDSLLSKLT